MTDLEKTQLVQNTQSSDELFEVFKLIQPVQGSHKEYFADKLTEYLQILYNECLNKNIPMEKVNFNILTRTHGIRAKALELIYYNKRNM